MLTPLAARGLAINALDLLILVVFMAIVGYGFFSGITRVVSSIFAIYFAAVCAAAFYRPAADLVRRYVNMGQLTGQLVFFVLIFLVLSLAFTVLIDRWIGIVRLPRRLLLFDTIGGAALGVVVSALALTLAAMLLTVLLQAINQVAQAGTGPLLDAARGQIKGSALVPIFLRLAPYVSRALAPWFPGGLPPILGHTD